MVGGIDLNKPRLRHVAEAVIAFRPQPTASPPPHWPRSVARSAIRPLPYGPRHAAYDLKKFRGKQIVHRIGPTRRYEALPSGLRAITALLVLRDKAIKPLLAAAQDAAQPAEDKTHTYRRHYDRSDSHARSLS